MVKYLVLIVSVILDPGSIQAQIPNGGFEFWEEVLNYEKPTGWWTNQDTLYSRIEKDTISIEGNYSLKMIPGSSSSWHGCVSRASIHVDFSTELGSNSALTFFAKTISIDTSVNNDIYLRFYVFVFDSTTLLNSYEWIAPEPMEEFTQIEIPLPDENINAISIQIFGGASTHPADGPCIHRTISWIDGMTIDLGTPVGSFISQEKNDIIIYPNPSKGVVNIMARDEGNIGYELYSLIGELIDKGKINNNQLNIHDQGMYILKLYAGSNERKNYSSKLIIIKE